MAKKSALRLRMGAEGDAVVLGVSARMRWAREATGISQHEMARRLGLNQAVLSFSETGKNEPEILLMQSYVNTLGITADFLLFGAFGPREMDRALKRELLLRRPELLAYQRGKGKNCQDTNQ